MSGAQHQSVIPCTVSLQSLHRFAQAIPVKKSSRASATFVPRPSDGAIVPLALQQRRQGSGGRISRTSSAGSPERAVPGERERVLFRSFRRAPEASVTPSLYLGHDLSPSSATGFSRVSSARSGEKLLRWKRVNISLLCVIALHCPS